MSKSLDSQMAVGRNRSRNDSFIFRRNPASIARARSLFACENCTLVLTGATFQYFDNRPQRHAFLFGGQGTWEECEWYPL